MCVKYKTDGVLSEEGVENLFSQIYELWIEPEISRRKQAGSLPEDFKIFRCLIRLPKDKPPIVKFDHEIEWIASVKAAPSTSFKRGQRIFLHEIQKVEAVHPPEVEDQRVAFIYLF